MRRGPETGRVVIIYNVHVAGAKFLDHTPFVVVMPTFYVITPKFQTPHPLNSVIYGPKLASILSLCLCHTSISAIELYSRILLLNRDMTGT